MALKIDGFNLYFKQGDAIAIKGTATGEITVEIGDNCKLQIKNQISDDVAVIEKEFTVITENEFEFSIDSSETASLSGTYYWSVLLEKSPNNKYTIIPDDGDESYPRAIVGGVLVG